MFALPFSSGHSGSSGPWVMHGLMILWVSELEYAVCQLKCVRCLLHVVQLMSSDKDFRYMATSDLLQELKKESIRLDIETERKICRVVLQQMQDISGDISNLAIKW